MNQEQLTSSNQLQHGIQCLRILTVYILLHICIYLFCPDSILYIDYNALIYNHKSTLKLRFACIAAFLY